ncbi:hypothetical protein CXB51_025275 [Gossypium anomalum]|uniref:Reverse transcriptase Ty1/copia-type domain-containing protein n=1 Tax=Gossypium anomalum TaxID=47600 RepID=A0A8J5YGL7_9ROSI|nr:hypothetical protein CXB51_025275 [Gossypium anomalum]
MAKSSSSAKTTVTNVKFEVEKFDDLLNLDEKFEDEDKALLLLNSLSDGYDHLITILLHGKDTITFDAVCNALYRSETRKKDKKDHRDTTAEVLTVRGRSHSSKPGRRGKSKGRPAKDESEHDEESDFIGMAMACHTDKWILDSGFSVKDADLEATKLWHMRLGQAGEKALQNLTKQGLLKGANSCKLEFCEHCVLGKQTRVKFGSAIHNTKGILDYVHNDVWGPTKVASLGGMHYFKKMVETQTGRKVKQLRSDNGTEYKNDPFLQACQDEGIRNEYRLWCPDTRKIIFRRDVELEKVNDDPANIEGTNDEEISTQELLQQQDSIAYRRPIREICMPARFDDMVVYALPIADDDILSTYTKVRSNPDGVKWNQAMNEEMQSLHKNRTWELVTLPKGKKAIGCKWILLPLVAQYDLELVQLDVKTAFSHGDLQEEIYMTQLDGLKKLQEGIFIYLLLYVDDMLIASKSKVEIERLKTQLNLEFEMKDLGEVKKILGMEICRDRAHGRVSLSQKQYWKKVLQRFDMNGQTKHVSTPLASHFKLSAQLSLSTNMEQEYMLQVPYSNAVGSLMYAMVCTRPGISQAVSIVSRYMHNPGKGHWQAVK